MWPLADGKRSTHQFTRYLIPQAFAKHGRTHYTLCDNIVAAKIRAARFSHLLQCRQITAHALACNLQVSVRWFPSEANPADHCHEDIVRKNEARAGLFWTILLESLARPSAALRRSALDPTLALRVAHLETHGACAPVQHARLSLRSCVLATNQNQRT